MLSLGEWGWGTRMGAPEIARHQGLPEVTLVRSGTGWTPHPRQRGDMWPRLLGRSWLLLAILLLLLRQNEIFICGRRFAECA